MLLFAWALAPRIGIVGMLHTSWSQGASCFTSILHGHSAARYELSRTCFKSNKSKFDRHTSTAKLQTSCQTIRQSTTTTPRPCFFRPTRTIDLLIIHNFLSSSLNATATLFFEHEILGCYRLFGRHGLCLHLRRTRSRKQEDCFRFAQLQCCLYACRLVGLVSVGRGQVVMRRRKAISSSPCTHKHCNPFLPYHNLCLQ